LETFDAETLLVHVCFLLQGLLEPTTQYDSALQSLHAKLCCTMSTDIEISWIVSKDMTSSTPAFKTFDAQCDFSRQDGSL